MQLLAQPVGARPHGGHSRALLTQRLPSQALALKLGHGILNSVTVGYGVTSDMLLVKTGQAVSGGVLLLRNSLVSSSTLTLALLQARKAQTLT